MDSRGDTAFAWHGRELVFGYAPCVCTGFLLTALPRWTGRTPSHASEMVLVVLWLAGRFAFALPPTFAPIIAAALIGLAAVVSFHVIAAADRRNYKVIALLWLSAAGGLFATVPGLWSSPDLGLRLGIAASLGLAMTVGGRLTRSLTESLLQRRGKMAQIPPSPLIEGLAAYSAAAGLVVWVFDPTAPPMIIAGALAAVAQVLRLTQWHGWRVIDAPSIFTFHVAYSFVPLGFALFAVNAWLPGAVPEGAALHAWTAGAIGMMTLSVMASMIRRHTGRSFVTSRTGIAVLAFAILAATTRIAAPLTDAPEAWLIVAAACWVVAFVLFVFDFRMPLLTRG